MSRKKPNSGKFSSSRRDSPERYEGSNDIGVGETVLIGKAMCRQSCLSNASSAAPKPMERSNAKITRPGL
eukprot:scaffold80848_cov30-Tisochrysis_lutea.AAC.10